jgi:hypothetical protein
LLTEIIHAAQQAAQDAAEDPQSARRLHDAFGAIVRDGIAASEVTRSHPFETLTETILGSYYALMFNWANLEGYPIADRARSAAAFLASALAPRPGESAEAAREPRKRAAVRVLRRDRTAPMPQGEEENRDGEA